MHAALGFLLILTVHRCYPAGVPRCLQGNFIRKQIRRYSKTLCFIWLFAIVINVPLFFLTKYEQYPSNENVSNRSEELSLLVASCETEAREIWSRMYLILLLVFTYLITGIFLVVIYGQVIRIILHSTKYTDRTHHAKQYQFLSRNLLSQKKFRSSPTSSTNSSNKATHRHSLVPPIGKVKSFRNSHSSQHLQVIIMLFVVILLYIILLLPYRLLNLLFIVSNELFQNGFINEILFQWLLNIVRLLVFLNCALQPIIYMIISSRLRHAVMKFFQWKTFCHCQCSIINEDEQQQQHFQSDRRAVRAYLVQKHQHVSRPFNQPKKTNSRNDFLPPNQQQLIDYCPVTSIRAYQTPASNLSSKTPYTVTFKNSLRR